MILTIKKTDPLSWLAHAAGMLAIIAIIGYPTGHYDAGYAFGLCVYFVKEFHENGTVEIWKWKKLDSVLDFVFPLVAGGIALRIIERIV